MRIKSHTDLGDTKKHVQYMIVCLQYNRNMITLMPQIYNNPERKNEGHILHKKFLMEAKFTMTTCHHRGSIVVKLWVGNEGGVTVYSKSITFCAQAMLLEVILITKAAPEFYQQQQHTYQKYIHYL